MNTTELVAMIREQIEANSKDPKAAIVAVTMTLDMYERMAASFEQSQAAQPGRTRLRSVGGGGGSTNKGGVDPRLPAVGEVISRVYNDEKHEARVLEGGRLLHTNSGKEFGSVSGVAKEITGRSTNGYDFFYLGDKTPPPAGDNGSGSDDDGGKGKGKSQQHAERDAKNKAIVAAHDEEGEPVKAGTVKAGTDF